MVIFYHQLRLTHLLYPRATRHRYFKQLHGHNPEKVAINP